MPCVFDSAVEIDQTAEVVAERQRGGVVDWDSGAALLPNRGGEVPVEIGGDEADVSGASEQLADGLVEDSGLRGGVIEDLPRPDLDVGTAALYPAKKPIVRLILFKGDPGRGAVLEVDARVDPHTTDLTTRPSCIMISGFNSF